MLPHNIILIYLLYKETLQRTIAHNYSMLKSQPSVQLRIE